MTDLDDATCSVCGQLLTGDPDDQPDPPAGPMCGECSRAREFDQTLWEADASGGGTF
jgi:hypothetical protein